MPKLGQITWTPATIAAATVAAVVLFLFLKAQAKAAVAAVGNAVDPTSSTNAANSLVTHIGAGITQDPEWTLGGALFGAFNRADESALASQFQTGGPKP